MSESISHADADHDTLLIPSRLFGPLRVSSTQVITFPDGLFGFGGVHRFVLLPAASDGVFWLHSIEEGNLAFLVIEPTQFFAAYAVDVDPREVPFDVGDKENIVVLTIVTLPRDGNTRPTANLRAPVVLNYAHRCGCQLLLKDSDYPPRHAFDFTVAG